MALLAEILQRIHAAGSGGDPISQFFQLHTPGFRQGIFIVYQENMFLAAGYYDFFGIGGFCDFR